VELDRVAVHLVEAGVGAVGEVLGVEHHQHLRRVGDRADLPDEQPRAVLHRLGGADDAAGTADLDVAGHARQVPPAAAVAGRAADALRASANW
jgi:hypothetical protein